MADGKDATEVCRSPEAQATRVEKAIRATGGRVASLSSSSATRASKFPESDSDPGATAKTASDYLAWFRDLFRSVDHATTTPPPSEETLHVPSRVMARIVFLNRHSDKSLIRDIIRSVRPDWKGAQLSRPAVALRRFGDSNTTPIDLELYRAVIYAYLDERKLTPASPPPPSPPPSFDTTGTRATAAALFDVMDRVAGKTLTFVDVVRGIRCTRSSQWWGELTDASVNLQHVYANFVQRHLAADRIADFLRSAAVEFAAGARGYDRTDAAAQTEVCRELAERAFRDVLSPDVALMCEIRRLAESRLVSLVQLAAQLVVAATESALRGPEHAPASYRPAKLLEVMRDWIDLGGARVWRVFAANREILERAFVRDDASRQLETLRRLLSTAGDSPLALRTALVASHVRAVSSATAIRDDSCGGGGGERPIFVKGVGDLIVRYCFFMDDDDADADEDALVSSPSQRPASS